MKEHIFEAKTLLNHQSILLPALKRYFSGTIVKEEILHTSKFGTLPNNLFYKWDSNIL